MSACRLLPFALTLIACLFLTGCPSPYEWRHENQWDSHDQIGMAEDSQVKLRTAQSRAFDTVDSRRILEAIVTTMQDLNFTVQVLDEELGLVSGKRLVPSDGPPSPSGQYGNFPYNFYDDQSLLIFSRNNLGWGPFFHRDDLVRLTVTVRKRNEKQSVVRASVQFYLRAVENPEPYQAFFRALEESLFLGGKIVPESG